MSDLSIASRGCGCGCDKGKGGFGDNPIFLILILLCLCGGDNGLMGGNLFGGDSCGCGGCLDGILPIILILCLCC